MLYRRLRLLTFTLRYRRFIPALSSVACRPPILFIPNVCLSVSTVSQSLTSGNTKEKPQGKTQAELQSDEKYLEWLKGGYDAAPPNGESYGHFTLRCLEGLEEIFKDMMANEVTSAAVITHSGVIMNLLSGYGLPKMKPIDFACNQGEGFEIQLSTFLWQHGPVFEIVGKLF